MRKTHHASFLLAASLVLLALPGCAPVEPAAPAVTASAPKATILPLKSLRLYETGVGYFERAGTIDGKDTTTLPVPAGHLDDALKSLVVLGQQGGAPIAGVSFSSSVTRGMARSRAGLPADPDSPIAFKDLLTSMKGERVIVSTRTSEALIAGRVVEVTIETDVARARALALIKDAKQDDPKHLVLTLLTASGEVTQLDADDIVRIRPIDAAFAGRLDAAIDALSTRNAQNARALHLLGENRGAVTFGYITETPIWRASYRLIFDAPATPAATAPTTAITNAPTPAILQGWALVHNDTDETWQGVHMELVNGEPDSFVFPLAAPRYSRRELVHPDDPLSTLPQLQSTTADALWGEHLEGHGSGTGTGYGYGSGHGRLSGSHQSRAPQMRMGMTSVNGATTSSSVLSVGNLAELAPAAGTEQGALFVYAVPQPFSLDAHASALVPFLAKGLDVERIAFFANPTSSARAAVRFVNATGQTLPAGTLSVFGSGGFSGETSLDRLKPGERRYLQIGNDLDTEVTEKKRARNEESKKLTFEGDRLEEHFLRTTDYAWELENKSGSARAFYVALAADKNAKVTGTDRVDFDEAAARPVVVFQVAAKQKGVRTFTVVEGLSRMTSVDGITEKEVRTILAKATIPAADLNILSQALPAIRAFEAERTQVTSADESIAKAQQELERLREDLKALGGGNAAAGGGAAAAPLVKRVVDAEERVAAAEKNKEAAEKAQKERREAVKKALEKLTPPPPG